MLSLIPSLGGATSWILGITGLSSIVGLAVMAVIGVPILPTLAKFADTLLTPLLGVVGTGLASLVKLEVDGGVDIMQTGQRMLFVVTCCVISYQVAVHKTAVATWATVHENYTVLPKQTIALKPLCKFGHTLNCRR